MRVGRKGRNPRFKLEWPELYQLSRLGKSTEGDNNKGKFSCKYADMEMIERHVNRKEKVVGEMHRVSKLQRIIIQNVYKQ